MPLGESNLIRTFIALNLHHMTHSKTQLHINIISKSWSIYIPWLHQKGHGQAGQLWVIGFYKQGRFELFLKDAMEVAFHMLSGRSFEILGSTEGKTMTEMFDLRREELELAGTTSDGDPV